MVLQYYRLPISFKVLISKEEDLVREAQEAYDREMASKGRAGNKPNLNFKNRMLKTVDLETSIAQNIFLIITSSYKENRFDGSYGCELWDLDFELVSNENMWLETVRKSVYNSIIKHETRLDNINVDITITLDDGVMTLQDLRSIKKRLTVFVNGTINQTGEEFKFNTNIYLSPLSID